MNNPQKFKNRVLKVVGGDGFIGGYNRGRDAKIIKLLQEGCVGVIPTDTVYGLIGSALNRKTVERIYRVRERNPKKPFIILISSLNELKQFGAVVNDRESKFLKKVWPGKISVILNINNKSQAIRDRFKYLHRGIKTLAFRMPAKKSLFKIIKKTGPLVAPSANPEGLPPAKTANEAKKYFSGEVDFYVNGGKMTSRPSTLISIKEGRVSIERRGSVVVQSQSE